jgi:hypothetical protein
LFVHVWQHARVLLVGAILTRVADSGELASHHRPQP